MSNSQDLTEILARLDREGGSPEQLLPLVYDELRKLASASLAHEKPGQTLQPTALVHEAYLRLVKPGSSFANRRHFFAAAAEAMRRILVEIARHKNRIKHGGGFQRRELPDELAILEEPDQFTALEEALTRLETSAPQAAELVKLRYFAGCTNAEAASLLEVSPRKADQLWAYARAWLLEEMSKDQQSD